MQLEHTGIAGTLESGDIQIEIEKSNEPGISIELTSTVGNQFGNRIKEVIRNSVTELGIKDAKIFAVDKGALDCTIKARVNAAVYRGCDSTAYKWDR